MYEVPIKIPPGLADKLMDRVERGDYYLKVKVKEYTADEQECRDAMIAT